ncbi:hypothetical protein [Natronorubrum halophilum]|uniref:hypothetical protein n=1 Tax=Natronorubrum halophilum TaxID=1702106 RepID=UPI0010C1669D|nr:hypothetical protein [Natronorubrum halophilum]
MNAEKTSALVDWAEWIGAGLCLAGLYLAGRSGQLGAVFFIVLTMFFILTTRAFRTDRDALLES